MIYQAFAERSQSSDVPLIWPLTRLFYGIASPAAFDQLRETCTSLRQRKDLPIPQSSNDLFQTARALDGLDVHVSVASILRRYHLVTLKAHRQALEEGRQRAAPIRTRKALKRFTLDSNVVDAEAVTGFIRADSQALTKMMNKAYPHLQPTRRIRVGGQDEYQKKLGALKERLRSGRSWHSLQERFTPSILALVPTGGKFKINDSE